MSRIPAYPRHSRSAERWRGQETVWGKEGIPSPSFASSRQGSTNRLSQPPFSFSCRLYVVSLSLLDFSIARLRRRSSVSQDALAEMSEAQMQMRLIAPRTAHSNAVLSGKHDIEHYNIIATTIYEDMLFW